MMHVQCLTLFPAMFPGVLGHSLAGRALEAGVWSLRVFDISEHAQGHSIDDEPFGGGPGMVMRPDVLESALQALPAPPRNLIYPTPKGIPFTQRCARELAAMDALTFLCGRYEGIDQRILDKWQPREVSLGDFVLSGGEVATLAILDSIIRLLPGVVGSPQSVEDDSFSNNLLEYPHYTRPRTWQGRHVPEVLLSGHHRRIQQWRTEQAQRLTRLRRPDLHSRSG